MKWKTATKVLNSLTTELWESLFYKQLNTIKKHKDFIQLKNHKHIILFNAEVSLNFQILNVRKL